VLAELLGHGLAATLTGSATSLLEVVAKLALHAVNFTTDGSLCITKDRDDLKKNRV
jgi:hypothetical protein